MSHMTNVIRSRDPGADSLLLGAFMGSLEAMPVNFKIPLQSLLLDVYSSSLLLGVFSLVGSPTELAT